MADDQAREDIDIEALLVRAYFEKQIDRLGGGVAAKAALGMLGGPKAPGATMGGAEKVDTSSYAARMAAEVRELELRLRRAPPALVTLHDAVLALPDFYAEISGLDYLVWDVETATRLGHTITPDRDRPTIVEDKGGAPRAVTRIVTATLMVVQGREAQPPYVAEVEVARMRPVYSGEHRKVTGHVPEYVVSPTEVAHDRAAYSAWHCALGMLAALDLPGYRITGPRAPSAPWEIERRIHPGGALPGLVDAPEDAVSRKRLRNRKKSVAKAA